MEDNLNFFPKGKAETYLGLAKLKSPLPLPTTSEIVEPFL
jgi:hypothetical protein